MQNLWNQFEIIINIEIRTDYHLVKLKFKEYVLNTIIWHFNKFIDHSKIFALIMIYCIPKWVEYNRTG